MTPPPSRLHGAPLGLFGGEEPLRFTVVDDTTGMLIHTSRQMSYMGFMGRTSLFCAGATNEAKPLFSEERYRWQLLKR